MGNPGTTGAPGTGGTMVKTSLPVTTLRKGISRVH